MERTSRRTHFPPRLTYIAYDFEPTYQPEFTFDERRRFPLLHTPPQSRPHMAGRSSRLHSIRFARKPCPSRGTWDSSRKSARRCHGRSVTTDLTQGLATYQTDGLKVRDDVMAVRPDLKLCLQVSFALNTPEEVLGAAQWLQTTPGISGMFVIYDTSTRSLLVNLMQDVRP
jgi:hypothetical protein